MQHMLLDIPRALKSDRLRLQPYQTGDGGWLHRHYQRDQPHLSEAIWGIQNGLGLCLTDPEDAEIYVRQLQADWAAHRRFVFGVWDKASGSYSGSIWIECRDWHIGLHEIGYYTTSEFIGRGYATEAGRTALQFIFHDLVATKAILTCPETNVASYRVAERCGFVREGCLRQQLVRPDGSLGNELIYGLLRKEFLAAVDGI